MTPMPFGRTLIILAMRSASACELEQKMHSKDRHYKVHETEEYVNQPYARWLACSPVRSFACVSLLGRLTRSAALSSTFTRSLTALASWKQTKLSSNFAPFLPPRRDAPKLLQRRWKL